MKTLNNYPSKLYIGSVDNEKIYLTAPSWDSGWYWGFGYIGNNNCHYHVDGLKRHETYNTEKKCFEREFINLYDGFKKHFNTDFVIRESQLWEISELFETFYALKQTAEILGRGGSGYTTNPCKDIIINTKEVERINNIVLPAIFDEIYKILIPAQDNKKLDKKLIELIVNGDAQKVINFMNKHKISTDDLKNITGVTKDDFDYIHSYYWKQYHANKKN